MYLKEGSLREWKGKWEIGKVVVCCEQKWRGWVYLKESSMNKWKGWDVLRGRFDEKMARLGCT